MSLKIKNWEKFQHYKDRNPPWIKLATDTFQNYDFGSLQDASKLLAICIWTLATRSKDGDVPHDLAWIKSQCNLGKTIQDEHLKELILKGFIIVASNTLATCKQSASPETEGEGEAETEGEAEVCAEPVPDSTPTDDSPVFLKIPTVDKRGFPITELQIKIWQDSFPGVNVKQQLKAMVAWCDANTSRRKTYRGAKSFVVSWLSREQNRGGSKPMQNRTQSSFGYPNISKMSDEERERYLRGE